MVQMYIYFKSKEIEADKIEDFEFTSMYLANAVGIQKIISILSESESTCTCTSTSRNVTMPQSDAAGCNNATGSNRIR